MNQGATVLPCYGNAEKTARCKECELFAYCRDFAAAERALEIGKSPIVGKPEWIPAVETSPKKKSAKKYTDEDLLHVVRFFLTLNVEEMRILQLRLTKPEFTNNQIAQLLGVNRKHVYEFFQRETMRIPDLARLLYRQKNKRK